MSSKEEILVKQMTLEEKASLMSGANFWNTMSIQRLGIPSVMMTDGPHGVRKQGGNVDNLGMSQSIPATCFPTAATLANSWDLNLLNHVGKLLGEEAKSMEVSVLLGPALNIKRNPLCGRNFEYFSEDPFLAGKLASSMIQGMQETGIAACPKHFAVNSQEERRMVIDEVVDERSFREMYLEGFRYAIEEGKAKTIMSSYNKINGTFASENTHLLHDILYKEWGFNGVVITDWGANNERVKGLIAGNQLEMPSSAGSTNQEIIEAVRNGTLAESILDQRVESLLRLVYDTLPKENVENSFDFEIHHSEAIHAAEKSIVLLKNEDHLLPLQKGTKVAVIGDFAKFPRYQGAGSSIINPTKLDNPLDELLKTDLEIIGFAKGYKRLGGKNISLKNKALKLASKSDVVLLFMGLDEGSESEGIDRENMLVRNNQIELLQDLSKVNQNVVIVLVGGAPVEMTWDASAKSVLHAYLSGQGSGRAIANLITGVVNPSGKLAETYPIAYSDVSSSHLFPGKQMTSEHREGIYFGYRYYDKLKMEVKYPFGHGLSYTVFEYTDLRVKGNQVSFTIQNTGTCSGEEVAQVYISALKSEVFRAEKELKGFIKVSLQPKESKKVSIKLDEHAFAYFNILENKWVVEGGEYRVMVGASSRDIRLTELTSVEGPHFANPYDLFQLSHYDSGDVKLVTDEEFASLLGRVPPVATWDVSKPLGFNDTIGQGVYGKGLGKFLYRTARFVRKFLMFIHKPMIANYSMFVMNLPYRQVYRMSSGKIDRAMLEGLLVMVNGKFFKGYKQYRIAKKAKKRREKENRHD